MTRRHAPVLLSIALFGLGGCDELSETSAASAVPPHVAVTDAMRAEALTRAEQLETAGRPEREAWERALAALERPEEDLCPAEALAAARQEHLVAVRGPGFHSDVMPEVLEIVLRRYGRSFPELDQAERLRLFAGGDDGELLAETLAETATPRSPRNVVVLSLDALEQARRVGDDQFESGELSGRAYFLVAPDYHVACTFPVHAENGDTVEAQRFGSLSMFDAQALLELFERAERDVDLQLAPASD